jgi:hypothetical protein
VEVGPGMLPVGTDESVSSGEMGWLRRALMCSGLRFGEYDGRVRYGKPVGQFLGSVAA